MLSSEQTHTHDLFHTTTSTTRKCQHCGSVIAGRRAGPSKGGSKARYCSNKCQQVAKGKRRDARLKAATGVGRGGQWSRNNPKAMLVLSAKHRARQKGLPFDLTVADIVIPTHCPALGIPLFRNVGKTFSDNSPSLDRVDPAKGYVRGNVAVISALANTIKSNATHQQIRAVADWLEQWYVNTNATLNMGGEGI